MTDIADDLRVQADTEATGTGGENAAGEGGEWSPPETGIDQMTGPGDYPTPEGMDSGDGLLDSFRQAATRHGLSHEAFSEVAGLWSGYVGNLEQAAGEMHRRAEAELHQEWGPAFEANVDTARRAVEAMGGPELVDFLNDSGLGSHGPLVKAFWRVGSAMSEDRLATGPHSGPGATRSVAEILYGSK